jgi:hypothetical protein
MEGEPKAVVTMDESVIAVAGLRMSYAGTGGVAEVTLAQAFP